MLRPIENPYLHGHAMLEDRLVQQIRAGTLPHALLFAGPRGIGKATLAYRLARSLLTGEVPDAPMAGLFGDAPEPQALGIADDHPVFHRIVQGSHSDMLVIQPEYDEKKKTSIDTVFVDAARRIIDFLRHTPAEGQWRVVIIDPVEALNTAAANAVLKILEEPPAQAVLILISHHPGKLLPTIRSRCRLVPMQAPADDAVVQILAASDQTVPEDERPLLQAMAQGSPGLMLELKEQGALEWYAQLLSLFADDGGSMSQAAAQFGKVGPEEWPACRTAVSFFLYRIGLYAASPADFTPLHPLEQACCERLIGRHPLDYWLRLWEKAQDLLSRSSTQNLDRKQVFISLFHAINGELLIA